MFPNVFKCFQATGDITEADLGRKEDSISTELKTQDRAEAEEVTVAEVEVTVAEEEVTVAEEEATVAEEEVTVAEEEETDPAVPKL
jgi:hypothetical protein